MMNRVNDERDKIFLTLIFFNQKKEKNLMKNSFIIIEKLSLNLEITVIV